jgi:hypothetical protein
VQAHACLHLVGEVTDFLQYADCFICLVYLPFFQVIIRSIRIDDSKQMNQVLNQEDSRLREKYVTELSYYCKLLHTSNLR